MSNGKMTKRKGFEDGKKQEVLNQTAERYERTIRKTVRQGCQPSRLAIRSRATHLILPSPPRNSLRDHFQTDQSRQVPRIVTEPGHSCVLAAYMVPFPSYNYFFLYFVRSDKNLKTP